MCERLTFPDGSVAIVCGVRHRRRPPCVQCRRPSEVLCDHRNGDGRTCDAPLCRDCALHVGRNRDYCRAHARAHAQDAPARLPFMEER
jgi:hypothetical protein